MTYMKFGLTAKPFTHTGSVDITLPSMTVYGTCLLSVFPATVSARNVETPVPEDVHVFFGSVLGMW